MRYRITAIRRKAKTGKAEVRRFRRAGADSPRRLYGYRLDEIDLATLFELKKLEGPTATPRERAGRDFFGRIGGALRNSALAVTRGFVGLLTRLKKARQGRRRLRREWVLPTLAGALAGVLTVAVISAFAVLYKLVISDYFGRYKTVTVPLMVGTDYDTARAMLDENFFNIAVSFEYSGSVPYGEVISQTPGGNVQRKIYESGSLPTVSIVVSLGKESFIMKDYAGCRARDAALELMNMGADVELVENYSDDITAGAVISSTPAKDESFAVDETVTLFVSLGKKKYFTSVPSLIGLTESRASARIASVGLSLGTVSYRNSSVDAGLVIAQSIEPYSSAEYGTRISLEISAGERFSPKLMPSLYGMTLEAARKTLADYGLVVGDIYAVPSSEEKGRVISQSPPADSDVSSSVVKVDLYVSS